MIKIIPVEFKPKWLIGLLVLFIGLGIWFSICMAFVLFGPIAQVSIKGDSHESTTHSLKNILTRYFEQPGLGRYFVFFKAHLIQEEILKLPWVAGCRIEKHYPRKILIQVQERQPVAWWGKSAILDQTGVIFKPEPLVHFEKLPLFERQDNLETKMLNYYENIKKVLINKNNLVVSKLQYSEPGVWTILLENGIQLISGDKYPVSKLEQFALVYQKNLQFKANQIRSVDLRYTNGFAIAWKSNQNEVKSAKKSRTGGHTYVDI